MFLTLSLVNHGELSIDRYAAKTIDKAEVHGKFYSDKAPGLSLLAVPVTAILSQIVGGQHDAARVVEAEKSGWPPAYNLLTYFATLSTSMLITALSVAALFLVASNAFGNLAAGTLVAVAYALATPAFGWATAFLGHAPAMGLACIGFACLHFLRDDETAIHQNYLLVVVGMACLTWAVVTEFTAAPVAVAVTVYGLRKIIYAKNQRLMLAGCALVTGFVFALPLLIYNDLAFGAPWLLGYQSVHGFPGMKHGFLGFGMPQLSVLYEITFGSRRGIILLSPLLALFPIGVLKMSACDKQGALAFLLTFIVAYYLLMNSAYYYWDGGYSTGPRHITAMLPFASLALGSVWNSKSRTMRALLLLLVLASSALALVCASTGMFAPTKYKNLLLDYLIPGFFFGGVTKAVPVLVPVHLFGWRLEYFLLGLVLFWFGAAVMIASILRRSRPIESQKPTPVR
jgi:hypothetical protein